MSTVLAQMPGQTVTIIQQILNADGYRQDGYIVPGYSGPNGEPIISRILQPGFVPATGFPATMTQLDTGLYTYNFVLPSGASAVGIYVVDLFWYNPTTLSLQQDVVLINVTAPFGVYTATVSGG